MGSKNVTSVVEDIYNLMSGEKSLNEDNVRKFAERLHGTLVERLTQERGKPILRMSNLGSNCDRKLWYLINEPEKAEPLPPNVRLKFLFGDIIEDLLLFLTEEAGHKVEGEQDTLDVFGIKGHRDAVIDGVVIDVKSASGRGFDKFKYHLLDKDDPFGYKVQLDAYLEASKDDPKVQVKNEGAFLVFNKESGHIVLDRYKKDWDSEDWKEEIKFKKDMLANPEPPSRAFNPVPDGTSGNLKLGVECSYCDFKHHCWPEIRTFLYSNGPRFLTKVVRVPDVTEV